MSGSERILVTGGAGFIGTTLVERPMYAGHEVDRTSGGVVNVGGGPANSVSVWREFGPMIAAILDTTPEVVRAPARIGDQRVFVADTSRLHDLTGWSPSRDLATAADCVNMWIASQAELLVLGCD